MFTIFSFNAFSQNPNYDSTLSKTLNADDYGMKRYVLTILSSGSNKSTNKSYVDSCFKSHMENIQFLVEQKKLIVAGPFFKNDDNLRGMFILDVTDFEEANRLLEKDLAIKENLLKANLYNWYGSAALSTYLENSEKIWKVKP